MTVFYIFIFFIFISPATLGALFKYALTGIQFDNNKNCKKFIHDVGNKETNKDHKYLVKY